MTFGSQQNLRQQFMNSWSRNIYIYISYIYIYIYIHIYPPHPPHPHPIPPIPPPWRNNIWIWTHYEAKPTYLPSSAKCGFRTTCCCRTGALLLLKDSQLAILIINKLLKRTNKKKCETKSASTDYSLELASEMEFGRHNDRWRKQEGIRREHINNNSGLYMCGYFSLTEAECGIVIVFFLFFFCYIFFS